MAIEKAFNIAIPNQSYVDDFSDDIAMHPSQR